MEHLYDEPMSEYRLTEELKKLRLRTDTAFHILGGNKAYWYKEMNVLFQQEQWEQLLVVANQVTRAMPDFADAWNHLGIAKDELGDGEGAVEDYNRAISLEDNYFKGYYNRALAQERQGNVSAAIRDFIQAGVLNPMYRPDFNERGVLSYLHRDYESAVIYYDKALESAHGNAAIYKNRANALTRLGHYEQALQDYNKSLQLDPAQSKTWYNRALTRTRMEDYRGALYDYDRAIELEPGCAAFYHNRACIKHKIEDYKGAIEDYNNAIQLSPVLAMARVGRGLARQELKDYQQAIEDYNAVVKQYPDHKVALYNRYKATKALQKP